jgi:hypothetical protein
MDRTQAGGGLFWRRAGWGAIGRRVYAGRPHRRVGNRPQLDFTGRLVSQGINRVTVDGKGDAMAVDLFSMGKRFRDIDEGPDGSLWILEDTHSGGPFRLIPK